MAAFVGPLLAGISGLAGLFGGGQQKSTTGQQTTSGTQTNNTNTAQSTNPNFSPLQQQLINMFTSGAQNQYNQGTNLKGYTDTGLQQINQTGDANQQAMSNILASRGQSFSPAATTALTQNRINTGNQQSQFLNSIPLLQRSLQQQNLSGLINAFGAIPTGTSSTGTSSGTQTSQGTTNQTGTVSGNPLAGLFGGLGSGLAAWLPTLGNSGSGNNNPATSL